MKHWDIIPPKKKKLDEDELLDFLKKAKLEPNIEKMPFYYLQPENEDRGCLHKQCPNCNGTGQSVHGTCIHMISCPCKSCSPYMMAVDPTFKEITV